MRRFLLATALLLPGAGFAQDLSPQPPAEKIRPAEPAPGTPAPSPGAPASDGAEALADDPLGVAANVATVRLSGAWDMADKKGFSRLVGVVDGSRQRFFVQWLAEPDGRIVETKELEDDEAAAKTFGDVRVDVGDTGATVFLDTVPDRDGIRETWVLIVGAPERCASDPRPTELSRRAIRRPDRDGMICRARRLTIGRRCLISQVRSEADADDGVRSAGARRLGVRDLRKRLASTSFRSSRSGS